MKKLAIFALTRQGIQLGKKIAHCLTGYEVDIYLTTSLQEKTDDMFLRSCQAEIKIIEGSLLHELTKQFKNYGGFVMIMALGVVVRSFSSLINDKRTDPPVLCLDERGQFVISVLSGHLGGANELATLIGEQIKAIPVITTATDVNNTISFDLLSDKFNLGVEPFTHLKYFNGAMVNGEEVIVYSDLDLPPELSRELINKGVKIKPLTNYNPVDSKKYHCIISGYIYSATPGKNHIFLRPKNLIVGLGCRRNTGVELIIKAIEESLAKINQSRASLKKIVSVELKKDEPGIIQAASYFQVPLQFFSGSQLQKVMVDYDLTKSEFVKQKIGVEGVCEPAAILGGKEPRLTLTKTVFPRITIAIAKEKFMW